MTSPGLSLILSIILLNSGNAFQFVNLNCNENLVAQFGQNSLLECALETSREVKDVKILHVAWMRYSDGREPEVVLEFKDGRPYPIEGYSFAESFWQNGKKNVSMLITKAAVEHEGAYECNVVTSSGSSGFPKMTSLKVIAKYSEPEIRKEKEKNSPNAEGVLECKSTGYPEGQLRWFDVHNKEWTNSATMDSKKTKDGRIQLSSRLPLLTGSNFSFTCAVFNATGIRESNVTYPDWHSGTVDQQKAPDPAPDPAPAVKIVAPLVVIGSLIVGLLLAMLAYKVYRQKRNYGLSISQPDVEGDHESLKVLKPSD